MTLSKLLSYIRGTSSKDVFEVLNELNDMVSSWAEKINISETVLLIVGLVLSIAIGFTSYKLIKLILSLATGYVGYFIGVELFTVLESKLMQAAKNSVDLPDWLQYVFGGLVALLFLLLAFKRASYALFMAAAAMGFAIVAFYTDSSILALGGAILVAFLSVIFVRFLYIWATSAVCGFLTVSFLSALLPKQELLVLKIGNWAAILIALAVTLLFAIEQFLTNKRRKE